MSPKDIKLNYFFNEPADKEKEVSVYLHYSIEDDIYTEGAEDSNFISNDFAQNSSFYEPSFVLNENGIDENIFSDFQDISSLESNYELEKESNKDDQIYFHTLEGNNCTDEEFNFGI